MLDLIGAYENYLSKVKQASSNTVASYMRDIRQFADWLRQEEELDAVDASQLNISHYLSHLEEDGRSGATVSRNLASLKNFYAYLVSSGFLEKHPPPPLKCGFLPCYTNGTIKFLFQERMILCIFRKIISLPPPAGSWGLS